MKLRQLNTRDNDFWAQLDALLAWESVSNDQVLNVVNEVIKNVRQRGDAAVVEYTNKFDRLQVKDFSELEISPERLAAALEAIPEDQRQALQRHKTFADQ